MSDAANSQVNRQVLTDLLLTLDYTFLRVSDRLDGLTDAEYLWAPVDGDVWTVRNESGTVSADWADPDPEPAPVTTIAWRIWHLAVDCLDSYSARLFGRQGTGLTATTFVIGADAGVALLRDAWAVFRDGIADSGDARLFELLGPAWGPYATSTRLALALHAQHEVVHHGAEIALLRDLYAASH